MEKAHELGLTDTELLNADQLRALEAHTQLEARGAIFFRCDAHLYPSKLMQNLLQHLQQNGVTLAANCTLQSIENKGKTVTRLMTDNGVFDADEVVIATGAWSREIAAMVQTKIPLMPGRGYSLTLENSPYQLNYPAVLAESRVAVTPMDGNKIRFGGTMEVVSTKTPPRYNRINGILKGVKRFYPEFDIPTPSSDAIWYGFRPCSADGLPYIGRVKHFSNVTIATGHSMLGLSLGAATGKLVKEIVNNEPTSIDMNPYRVERFG